MRLVPREIGRSVESSSHSDEDDGCGRHDRDDLRKPPSVARALVGYSKPICSAWMPSISASPDGAEPPQCRRPRRFRRRWVPPLFAPTAEPDPPGVQIRCSSIGHPGLAIEHVFDYSEGMERRLQLEQLRRSIAMLTPGAPDAVGREQALQLLTELHDVQGRLDDLKRRLRELAEET